MPPTNSICPACNAMAGLQHVCRLCESSGLVDEMDAAAWRLGGMKAAVPCPLCMDPASPWLLVRSEVTHTEADPLPYFEAGGCVCVLHPYHEAPLASDAAAFRMVGWEGLKHLLQVEVISEDCEMLEYQNGLHTTVKMPGRHSTEVQIRSPAGVFTYTGH